MYDGGDDDVEHIWVLLKRGKNIKIVDLNLEMITQDTLIVENESVHNSLKKLLFINFDNCFEKRER